MLQQCPRFRAQAQTFFFASIGSVFLAARCSNPRPTALRQPNMFPPGRWDECAHRGAAFQAAAVFLDRFKKLALFFQKSYDPARSGSYVNWVRFFKSEKKMGTLRASVNKSRKLGDCRGVPSAYPGADVVLCLNLASFFQKSARAVSTALRSELSAW